MWRNRVDGTPLTYFKLGLCGFKKRGGMREQGGSWAKRVADGKKPFLKPEYVIFKLELSHRRFSRAANAMPGHCTRKSVPAVRASKNTGIRPLLAKPQNDCGCATSLVFISDPYVLEVYQVMVSQHCFSLTVFIYTNFLFAYR
jgi:hypothetical protein